MTAVIPQLHIGVDVQRQLRRQGVGRVKLLINLLLRQRLAHDGQLPSVGFAAARLHGPHQAINVLKVLLFWLPCCSCSCAVGVPSSTPSRADWLRRCSSACRSRGGTCTKVNAWQLPFQGTAQVFHGFVQMNSVINHHAKVQVNAVGATIQQVEQAHGLAGIQRGIHIGQCACR